MTRALVALLAACSSEAACPDPITVEHEQYWADRKDSCPGVRLQRPNLDDCMLLSNDYADCTETQLLRCANGLEVVISVNSDEPSGYYVVRDVGGCESRWVLRAEAGG